MSATQPKFSVITVSFNQGEFIKQTIDSVIDQDYPNFEHIVIDGGSSDDTLDILKSYSHLDWISEPDNGQTHALNKGFAKANGDIIAWINSDDWYPKGVFETVAAEIEKYPIVMGESQIADRAGKPGKKIPNLEHSWFDLLKYWCSYAVPAQPSIFFRRELLEEVKYETNIYLDESLHYCMDYDLWLRFAQKYNFNHRIEKVLSYYRMYEENKTGGGIGPAQPEMKQLFKNYEKEFCQCEVNLSYIIPVCGWNPALKDSIDSIYAQELNSDELSNFEIIVVDYSESPEVQADLETFVAELSLENKVTLVRDGHGFYDSFNRVVSLSKGKVLALLTPGCKVNPDFNQKTAKLFASNRIALVFPWANDPEFKKLFLVGEEKKRVNIDAVFASPVLPRNLLVRKAALLEIGGLKSADSELLGAAELLLRICSKSWWVNIDNELGVSFDNNDKELQESYNRVRNYINAQLLSDVYDEYQADKFATLRKKEGFALTYPKEMTNASKALLKLAPESWWSISASNKIEKLLEITAEFPHFSPGWFFLGQKYEKSGQPELAQIARQNYDNARAVEMRH